MPRSVILVAVRSYQTEFTDSETRAKPITPHEETIWLLQKGKEMNNKSKASQITILGLMTAFVLVFTLTPIGSIPVGPLVISLCVIPVAIAAATLGPVGGLIVGTVFGIMSFLQCFGIGVPSAMGAALLASGIPMAALRCAVQRIIPRMLEGFLAGWVFKLIRKKNIYVAAALTGFATAFFNTLFFMSALVWLFAGTEYMQESMAGKGFIAYILASVGLNVAVEWIAATVITAAVVTALSKAHLLPVNEQA